MTDNTKPRDDRDLSQEQLEQLRMRREASGPRLTQDDLQYIPMRKPPAREMFDRAAAIKLARRILANVSESYTDEQLNDIGTRARYWLTTMPKQLTHDELCHLSRIFNAGVRLDNTRDHRINEWLKHLIASGEP